MTRGSVTSIGTVTALAVLAVSGALAIGAGSADVKTGQKANKLRIGKFQAQGQLRTAGGSRKAEKRCLKNRGVRLDGPMAVFARPSSAARAARALGSDKTNAKGEWSIPAPPDAQFAPGLYVVKVERKTLGGAKKGDQITKCGRHRKKVRRTR